MHPFNQKDYQEYHESKEDILADREDEEPEIIETIGEGDHAIHVWLTKYDDHDTFWISNADGVELESYIGNTRGQASAWANGYYEGRKDQREEDK